VSEVSHPFERLASQFPKFVLQAMEQAPSAHPAVPLLLLQTVPQAPQLVTLVCVLISQPFVATPSQLPKPLLHVPSTQLPDAQDSAALAKSQAAPHVPQFESVVRLVSQPFGAKPSQFANPPLQVPI
jgi:hypothetical protein